ncbi:Bor family protein [uncultured Psychrobacter sp.]|uniref:Bor family protein n=1 Tax=Psychrobacter sp. DM8 TaxID=3440636 RepID=UPI00293D9CF4|nr:Bor family protein [uncultured Psychrobacter sp.]
MKKLIMTALMGSALLASGCATQTALIQPTQQVTPTYSDSQTFFISGIGQVQSVDAAQVCNGAANVAKVTTMQSPKDVALALVTFGIYTPRTATVYCQ